MVLTPDIFVGVDTSCYTTSVAVVDSENNILINSRIMLPVKQGSVGLRQSEAVFAHIKNLNDFFNTANLSAVGNIKCVCVSASPRDVEGSYMPVFLTGLSFARAIASVAGAELVLSTHQAGHIYSAVINNPAVGEKVLAVHLSGGTGEILLTDLSKRCLNISIIGKTLDLSAGQLIDRIGVKLGFPFPAGCYLERMAADNGADIGFKTSVNNCDFNFSGVEAQAVRAIEAGTSPADICCSVEFAVAETLAAAVKNSVKITGIRSVLFFGGVICNGHIKELLRDALSAHGINSIFAKKEFSGDNACGLAVQARNVYAEDTHGK